MARRVAPDEKDIAAHRDRLLVDVLRHAAPGLVYIYDPVARRSIFNGGGALGFKPHEIEEMQDPVLSLTHPDDVERAENHFRELLTLPEGQVSSIEIRVRHKDGGYRHLICHDRILDRNEDGTSFTIFGVADDVTDLKQEVQDLAERLATAQIDERRVIAQELHDSAGQHVVAAELALLGAQARNPELAENPSLAHAMSQVMECLKDAQREIRVLSYLMHPPAISSKGLASILRDFAVGFGERARLVVDVNIDCEIDNLTSDRAVSLLRVCQEALTNVHRHAKASRVRINVHVRQRNVELTISDDGTGFDLINYAPGVGLAGMSERLGRLGGNLSIETSGGTTLTATLPLS